MLALDEATANVDQATDALIQQALRNAVKSSSSTSPRRTLLVGTAIVCVHMHHELACLNNSSHLVIAQKHTVWNYNTSVYWRLRNAYSAHPITPAPAFGHRQNRQLLQVIAHRIDTIMDCDQLLVLSSGRLVEQGAPIELSQRPSGAFARLTQAAQSGFGQRADLS